MSKNNLKITKSCDTVIAKFYNTEIVRVDNNRVTFNTGGFKTSLTKKSINRVLDMCKIPMSVFIHQGEWKVTDCGGNPHNFEENKVFMY
jgi:hypothetical protein